MRNTKIKNQEGQKGMISLVLAGTIAIIISMVMGQVVLNQLNANTIHASSRTQIDINLRLKALALRYKEAFNQSQVNTTCPGSLERRTRNGGQFCLPSGTSLCTNLTKVINGREIVDSACTSMRVADVRWDDGTSGNQPLAVEAPSSITSGVRNRIRVPALTNPLWQSCQAPNVCLRVILCPPGVTDCRINNAQAYQIIRL
jgi:hypothetical protein